MVKKKNEEENKMKKTIMKWLESRPGEEQKMTVDSIDKPDKTKDSKRDPASIFGIKLKKTVIEKPVIDRKKT